MTEPVRVHRITGINRMWYCDDMSLPSTALAVLGIITGLTYPSVLMITGNSKHIFVAIMTPAMVWLVGVMMWFMLTDDRGPHDWATKHIMGIGMLSLGALVLGSFAALLF